MRAGVGGERAGGERASHDFQLLQVFQAGGEVALKLVVVQVPVAGAVPRWFQRRRSQSNRETRRPAEGSTRGEGVGDSQVLQVLECGPTLRNGPSELVVVKVPDGGQVAWQSQPPTLGERDTSCAQAVCCWGAGSRLTGTPETPTRPTAPAVAQPCRCPSGPCNATSTIQHTQQQRRWRTLARARLIYQDCILKCSAPCGSTYRTRRS